MNKLLRTCRSLRPRWPRAASLQRLPLFRLPRPIQRVGGHNFKTFRGGAHSSHRFGLSARSAPALTRQLPFASGRVLHLGLLDFKAVIFASHKLNSRLLAHDRIFKRAVRNMLRCRPRRTISHTAIMLKFQVRTGGGSRKCGDWQRKQEAGRLDGTRAGVSPDAA
jgi:hypothetical protein